MALALSVGDIVGSYRLEERLGAGGGGSVFRAKHVLLGRAVAIKVLNDELVQDTHFVSRFLHEAKVVNDIRHPNIIDISDFLDLREPRRVAYVMELLSGRPLNDVVRSQSATLKQAMHAMLQIVSVMRAVHQTRVVHRDLKPANIFVLNPNEPEWNIKVLDFGVAKISSPDVGHRTETGAVVGTPTYMAPEQIWSAPVSPATDIYALGEILYEILTGRCLFSGERAVVLSQKVSGITKAPFDFPSVADPRAIEALIRECVQVEQLKRPTLDQIERALTKQLEGSPAAFAKTAVRPQSGPRQPAGTRVERPASKTPPPKTEPSRSGRLALAIAAAVGVLGLGIAAISAFESEPNATPLEAEVAIAPPIEEAAPPEAPTEKRVEVSTIPPGAIVTDLETKQTLGKTPVPVALIGTERRVELTLPGFKSVMLPLDATTDKIKVVLSAEDAVPAAKKQAVRPKKIVMPPPLDEEVEPAKPTPVKVAPLRKDEKTHW